MNLNKRLDSIRPRLESEEFRKGRGLANEINFYIFDYDPRDEMVVRNYIQSLKTSFNSKHDDIRIVEFDLYQLMLQILEDKNYLDRIGKMEEEKKSESVISPIKRTLHLTLKDDKIINEIIKDLQPNDIIFLTGVGKVWPIIRSHTVLNNLHGKLNKTPLILFYPGNYNDKKLILFKEIDDGNYYRAFRWFSDGV